MIGCPSPGEIQAYADRELAPAEAAVLARHVDGCPACQAIMSEIAGTDRMIGALFSREPIPAAPPFSLPAAAARPGWLWLSSVIAALAALVFFLAWRQIAALWLILEDHVWLAGRIVLHSAMDKLVSAFPELIIQLASGRLWNEQLLVQGIVQGLAILTIIGFLTLLKAQPRSRRHPI